MGEIKVTDKRMFTPDGRLKEEFEHRLAQDAVELAEEAAREAANPPAAAPAPEPAPPAAAPAAPFALPADGTAVPPPGLLELVEFLAGWALASMGEVPLPDGRLVRDLDGAKFYVDLLGSLRDRFGKGLSAQELHFVESYLDQLRLRYVSRRG